MKILTRIGSYLGIFVLGLYSASQIKFNTPVEDFRWVITICVTLMLIIMGNMKDDK